MQISTLPALSRGPSTKRTVPLVQLWEALERKILHNSYKNYLESICSGKQITDYNLNDDSYERQPERTAGHAHLCTEGNSCVSAATFGLGSWGVAFTHWEVYRARATNIQLCRKAHLTKHRRRQRICSMLMCDDFLLLFSKMP